MFTTTIWQHIFSILYYEKPIHIDGYEEILSTANVCNVSVLDITYIADQNISIMRWVVKIGQLLMSFYQTAHILRLMILWIHEKYLPQSILNTYLSSIRKYLPVNWTVDYSLCRVSQFGDKLDSQQYVFHISKLCQKLSFVGKVNLAGYQHCLSTDTSIPVAIENITIAHHTDIV